MRAALLVAALLAATGASAAGCGGHDGAQAPVRDEPTTAAATATAPSVTTTAVAGTPAAAPAGDPVARIVRRTTLRDAPGGHVLGTIGPRTEWGTPRYLPVVRRRADWLGVVATEAPNGRLGWVAARRHDAPRWRARASSSTCRAGGCGSSTTAGGR